MSENIVLVEIAKFDLGLYNHQVWRTFDGFFVADNNPKSLGVRFEANGFGITGSVGVLPHPVKINTITKNRSRNFFIYFSFLKSGKAGRYAKKPA